jgi:mannobiose 2-epimerase
MEQNPVQIREKKLEIAGQMLAVLKNNITKNWYPLVLDKEMGGYFTNIDKDWNVLPEQEKMIVSQARHVWVLSKLASFLGDDSYIDMALHGFDFLKNGMWDKTNGGFYQMRSRDGGFSNAYGYREEKRTYGNAFGIYSLAALNKVSANEDVLQFAQAAFNWLEEHAFDPVLKGYFQFMGPDGRPFDRNSDYKTEAYDDVELGYKDQNSSIHLLEAYTELYAVWKDERLNEKLTGLLKLIRDVITTPKGYMNLFFEPDWKPVSFRNAPKELRDANYRLDHVSFGHDYETAFLMFEASHTLGLRDDVKTLKTGKKMVDHAIENGFDHVKGGFFDEGYYFAGEEKLTIIKNTKNWWAQAEALNILLMMSRIFPDEPKYIECFYKQWDYVAVNLIDFEHGDWFEGGIDMEPQFKTGPKSHMWKCTYHTSRAMMNCITMLADDTFPLYKENESFKKIKTASDEFIEHWRKTAKLL